MSTRLSTLLLLPTATASALGGIKIGTGLSIDSNGVVTVTNAAYTQANAAYIQANSAYTAANSGIAIGQSAFTQANTALSTAQSAFTAANNEPIGQAAFVQANTAVLLANAAYNTANTKFSSSGGTITGSVTITTDLSVTGNVYLNGNVTTISSNTLSINDPMIYLAQYNPANLQDIGVVGHFTSGNYQHTGFVKDATDGVWKLFSNVSTEPTTTIDFSGGVIYDTIQVGKLVTSNGSFTATGTAPFDVVSNTVVTNLNADLFDGQHGSYYTGLSNSAFNQANVAYNQANTALSLANAAYNQANTGGGGGGGLTATAILTSAYTASKNQLVRCSTSGGAFSVTFPSSPSDGDIIGIIDVSNTFATNNLTLLPNTKFIESDSTAYILDINGAYVTFIYNTATTNWKLMETPNTTSANTLPNYATLGKAIAMSIAFGG